MMSKSLELVGFALIGGTIISFLGMNDSELRLPVFWGCAIGALAIIFYRKRQRKRNKIKTYRNRSIAQSKLHHSSQRLIFHILD